MKKIINLLMAVLWPLMIFSANINSVSNIQLNPAAPGPGEAVSLSWDFLIDAEFNNPRALVVVSDQQTLRPANTNGQWVMIGNSCVTPADPEAAQVTGGCAVGSNMGPSGGGIVSSGTYNFTLPVSLIPGFTYYIIIGMKDYNCYMNPSVDVSAQNYAAFTIPLPPPTIEINKIAEGSAALAGGYVLYTLEYYAANTNAVVLSDDVPANVAFIEAYDGGVFSGGTITWDLGDISIPQRGAVAWLGQISGSVSDGDVIDNYAYGNSSDLTNVQSDNAAVTIGSSLEIEKTANPPNVDVGDTITYTLSFTNSGYALNEYVDFDSSADISGWTEEASYTGSSWTVTGGYLLGYAGGTGNYPNFIKNTPSLHDAMYITDLYVPASNSMNGDALMVFNFIDTDNSYHARIQADSNQICFDRVVGGTYSSVQCATPSGFSIQYDRWYKLKVQVDGNNIRIKAWPKGSTEATTWAIDRTDTSHTLPGRVGYQANEDYDRYDNLKIFTPAPATNLRVWDTIPACTSFAGCAAGCAESGGVVSWSFPGIIGNEYYGLDFYVRAQACAANTTVLNTGCADSDEPAPAVCSNEAEVIVGVLDSPTSTITRTDTPTPTFTPTPSFTGTPTATETSPYTNTSTPTPTPTCTYTYTPTPTITYTITVTSTDTPVFTPTDTLTITLTATSTFTPTATATITPTSTPIPARLTATLEAIDTSTTSGGYARFRITISNETIVDAENVTVWDSLPLKTEFPDTYQDNASWSFNGSVFEKSIGTIPAGGTVALYFYLKTDTGLPTGDIILINGATASYRIYPSPAPVMVDYAVSPDIYISVGEIVVYPNPYNPGTAAGGYLKFANVPRGSIIGIYTVSGELVTAFNAQAAYIFWDGKNRMGKQVSSGIYFYHIVWEENGVEKRKKGKIFILRDK